MEGGEGDQLVAVHHGACAVHREHAVAVAVEREAHVVAAGRHGLYELLDMGRAAALVDVAAVGLGGHRLHIRAQAAEDLRRHAVGGPMGAVEQHAQPRQVERLEARLELAQVVSARAVELAHPAGRRRETLARKHRALHLALHRVGQLEAVGAEELDAVVLVRVVRGRHHAGEVEAEAADEQRRARRGEYARDQRVPACRGNPGGQRGLEHLAGLACVADDQDLGSVRRRPGGGRTAERQREVGSEKVADGSTNAIGAEEPALVRNHAHAAEVNAWRTAGAYGPSSGRPSCAPSPARRA